MRTFLHRTIWFSLFMITILLASIFLPKLLLNSSDGFYSVNPSKNILAVGDSHMECSVSTDVMNNTENLSLSADSYFFSYLKLKKIIPQSPAIDTVMIGFGYHNLSSETENRWTREAGIINAKIPKYFILMDWTDYFDVLKKTPDRVFVSTFLSPKKYVKPLMSYFQGNASYKQLNLGKHKKLSHDQLAANIELFEKKGDKESFQPSQFQMTYLLKIAEYCEEQDIALILVNTPIHSYMLQRLEQERAHYETFYQTHLDQHTLLNYAQSTYPDSLFADLTHLNQHGANIFTKKLKSDLSSK